MTRSIYSYDPNGVPIGFSHNFECIDLRKSPRMVDAAPSEVTEEGPKPMLGHWPPVERKTPIEERKIYPGAGSQLPATKVTGM